MVPPDAVPASVPARLSRRQRLFRGVAILLMAYLAIAYLMLPVLWERYFRRHPRLDEIPGITLTHTGLPGDPVNVALIGTEEQLMQVLHAAHWEPADPITLKSSLRIAADTVLRREYADAPVSPLYLFGRKEDLAFEQPVGPDPKERHHVRFWKSTTTDPDGRPFWFGAATFDRRVGFSHTTGEITHHIAPDVDSERDHLFSTLQATGDLSETYEVPDFHQVKSGKNGGGDPWHTDGALQVGTINPALP